MICGPMPKRQRTAALQNLAEIRTASNDSQLLLRSFACQGSFAILAFPVPGHPNAYFIERQQWQRHEDLGDHFWSGQHRTEHKADHDHVTATFREHAVVE